jgi:hypothetical protein
VCRTQGGKRQALKTSKEELHSLNEELNTVNNKLEEKVVELEKSNDDMANLLNSTGIRPRPELVISQVGAVSAA